MRALLKTRRQFFRGIMGILFVSIVFLETVSAERKPNPVLILSCHDISQTGLFEQCQEVQILNEVGDWVHAYSKPLQKVIQIKRSDLFLAKPTKQTFSPKQKQMISIPANLLWSISKEGFQSLCRVDAVRGDLLTISCGSISHEKIRRDSAYDLQPMPAAQMPQQKSELKTSVLKAN